MDLTGCHVLDLSQQFRVTLVQVDVVWQKCIGYVGSFSM